MKLIQAMKQLKDLKAKAEDLRKKVQQYCADLSTETPVYPDQKKQVREWIQAHHDILKEILRLRVAIQRTNLATQVSIELDGRHVTKSIAEWIHRRKDLSNLDMQIWAVLGDGNRKEGNIQLAPGAQPLQITIRRYWDQQERDKSIELYRSEPSVIDGTLEIVNATTDLLEKKEETI